MHDIGLASDVNTQFAGDELFAENVSNVTPNIGLGLFLHGEKYYL